MRNFVLVAGLAGSVGSLAVVASGFGPVRSGDAPRLATVTVSVDVRCPGNRVEFSVDPWQARLQQGDEIEWVLAESAGSDSIWLAPKRGRPWPFVGAAPRGDRRNPARGRDMRPNQGGRHPYDITLVCQEGDSGPYTVVIDPDMIIE